MNESGQVSILGSLGLGDLSIGLFLLLAVYTITHLVYNAYFHPLSKFPGPRLWGATRIPYFHSTFKGDLSFDFSRLHDIYGPVVRTAPSELSFIEPQAWQDIYGQRLGHKPMQKDPVWYGQAGENTSNIVCANDADHTRQRRAIAHAFSDKALRGQEPLIRSYIDLLMRRLNENVDGGKTPVNLEEWYNFTTFDIIGDLAYADPFGCLDGSKWHSWVKVIYDSIAIHIYMEAINHYPLMKAFLTKLIPKSLRAKMHQHVQFAIDKLDKRLSMKTDRKDFMSYILRHNDDRGLSPKEMQETSRVFVEAGAETTATALCGITYNLLKNPGVLQKLEAEIRGMFKSTEDIQISTVENMKYLPAVIRESLRLYPAVPSGLPRLVSPEGDIIAGTFVPGGSTVMVNQWTVGHSSRNFVDPEKFVPERWLQSPEYATDKLDSVQPFSVGPRNCIGRNLASMEMRLIISLLLFNFDISLDTKCKKWHDQKIYFLWKKVPLLVHLTPRKSGSA